MTRAPASPAGPRRRGLQRRLSVAAPCGTQASPLGRPLAQAGATGPSGEVAERLKAPHSKCGIPARVSRVRIPPSPPPPQTGGRYYEPIRSRLTLAPHSTPHIVEGMRHEEMSSASSGRFQIRGLQGPIRRRKDPERSRRRRRVAGVTSFPKPPAPPRIPSGNHERKGACDLTAVSQGPRPVQVSGDPPTRRRRSIGGERPNVPPEGPRCPPQAARPCRGSPPDSVR